MNFDALKFKAAGTTVGRTFGARASHIFRPADFGVVAGTPSAAGPPAADGLQAMFDAAFGPASSPHGESSLVYTNRAVHIPAGVYNVDKQLILTNVCGSHIYGDGMDQTILKYTGGLTYLPNPPATITALMTCRSMIYTQVEGICFDSNGAAEVAVWLTNTAATLGNDGTGDTWRSCAFKNSTISNFLVWWDADLSNTGGMGSEQVFYNCLWENSIWGHRLVSPNALDHTIFGGIMRNHTQCGISSPEGGVNAIIGTRFDNNTIADIYIHQDNGVAVIGPWFRSQNAYTCSVGNVVAAYHDYGSAGQFLAQTAQGTSSPARAVIDGCLSLNGTLTGAAGCQICLKGNRFGNAGYLTPYLGAVREGPL